MNIKIGQTKVLLLTILFGPIIGCESERIASEAERTSLLEQLTTLTALAETDRRFIKSNLSPLPPAGSDIDMVTGDDGQSFQLSSDRLGATIDSSSAQVLFTLRPEAGNSPGLSELLLRASQTDSGWRAEGVYIR